MVLAKVDAGPLKAASDSTSKTVADYNLCVGYNKLLTLMKTHCHNEAVVHAHLEKLTEDF